MTAQTSARLSKAQFSGEVHPLAMVWPMLGEDELRALADDIAESGLESPIVLDAAGRLVDGRNRLAACELAGVEPSFWTDHDLETEPRIARFINTVNAERRHLTAGQQAMGRALMLQAQGRRRNGRWERGALFQESGIADSATYESLKKAGLVLDVAARAAVLGDEYADWAGLPANVMARDCTLDFAYRSALDFETKATLAEAMKTQPLTEALLKASVILDDLDALLPLPVLDVPLTKDHRKHIDDINRRGRATLARFTSYSKENQ